MVEDEEDLLGSSEEGGSSQGFMGSVESSLPPGVSPSLDRINTLRRQIYSSAIRRGVQNLNSNTDRAAALFALGGGLASPTRGGTFMESLGQGMTAAAPYVARIGESDFRNQNRVDALTLQALNQEASNLISASRLGTGRYHELLRAAGIQPGTPEAAAYLAALRRAGGTNVTVNNAGPRAYEGARGGQQGFGGRANEIAELGEQAQSTIGTLDSLTESLNNVGPSGALTPVITYLQSAASSLGIEVPGLVNLSEAEQARALTNQLTTTLLGGRLGAGVSNADRDFIVNSLPSLSNSPGGNRLIAEGLRRVARRRIEAARELRRLEQEHGSDFRKIEDGMARWSENQGRVIDAEFRRRAEQLRERGGTQTGQPGAPVRGQWRGALPQGVPQGSTYRGVDSQGNHQFRGPDNKIYAVPAQ